MQVTLPRTRALLQKYTDNLLGNYLGRELPSSQIRPDKINTDLLNTDLLNTDQIRF